MARLTAPNKFNSEDSSVRIEVGNQHFATSRLIWQLITVIQLPVSKTDVADFFSHDNLLARCWHGCIIGTRPMPKQAKKPKKRGPKELRLVISEDPQTALARLLKPLHATETRQIVRRLDLRISQ